MAGARWRNFVVFLTAGLSSLVAVICVLSRALSPAANERDQAIVKAAVPDAGSCQIEFLPSLGLREAIAFGEGVALPTRICFKDLAKEFVPRSQSGRKVQLNASGIVDSAFMQSVVDRWRQTTIAGPPLRGGFVSIEADGVTKFTPKGELP